MAIFFTCSCGQSLRVEEDRAGGHTRCLACGQLARVPALHNVNLALGIESEPTNEIPAPIPAVPPVPSLELKIVEVSSTSSGAGPQKRPALPDLEKEAYPLVEPARGEDRSPVQKRMERKRLQKILADAKQQLVESEGGNATWRLEKHWYECLLYAVRALPMLAGLALTWATLTAMFVFIMPARWDWFEFIARFPLFLAAFLLLGYTLACLQATLAVASQGEAGYVAWAERDLFQTTRGGAQGLVSFLAGPFIPAAVAFFFWRDSGEFELIDWLILLELGLLAVAWWALTFLAVQESGRLADANPFAVARLIQAIGYRAAVVALIGSVVVVLHGLVSFQGVVELHHSLGGWLLIGGAWTGQLFWMVFLMRWLGVNKFYASKTISEKACATAPTA